MLGTEGSGRKVKRALPVGEVASAKAGEPETKAGADQNFGSSFDEVPLRPLRPATGRRVSDASCRLHRGSNR